MSARDLTDAELDILDGLARLGLDSWRRALLWTPRDEWSPEDLALDAECDRLLRSR